jgi:hypothetical protein
MAAFLPAGSGLHSPLLWAQGVDFPEGVSSRLLKNPVSWGLLL